MFETLHKNFSSPRYAILSVSLVDSSVFARKMEAGTVGELMPGISPILFEYRNAGDAGNSLFKTYRPDITPAIVVINKGRRAYLPYDSIYYEGKINPQLLEMVRRAMR